MWLLPSTSAAVPKRRGRLDGSRSENQRFRPTLRRNPLAHSQLTSRQTVCAPTPLVRRTGNRVGGASQSTDRRLGRASALAGWLRSARPDCLARPLSRARRRRKSALSGRTLASALRAAPTPLRLEAPVAQERLQTSETLIPYRFERGLPRRQAYSSCGTRQPGKR